MDPQRAAMLEDESARAGLAPHEFDRDWLAGHLADERHKASLLGEVREAIFGAQDGLVSTLAVVSTVAGASSERFPILIAGIASALAGFFSMAAGEFMSSKSQHEIFEAQIVGERQEVVERPGEAEAEIAYMFEEDGLPRDESAAVARSMAKHPEVLLKTMVEKELGLTHELAEGSPLQGALIMGGAFGIGAAVPVIPYLLLDVDVATWASVLATGAVLFAIGVVKSRWTRRRWLRSGAEILALGAFAGVAGFFFGNMLPTLLGAPAVGG
ncbi:MAG TPA: VIT1/CCC1 transporter family protein [Candidatus Limnocylindrales bacterium]|nr:VIT1/CCC1 transporter family protein [Candidatus Limnocylindrales bacterium]